MDPTGLDEQWYFVDPMGSMAFQETMYRRKLDISSRALETRMSRHDFAFRYFVDTLDKEAMRVLATGCVGITAVSTMKDPQRDNFLAAVLRGGAKYFRTYAAARAYYNSLRANGAEPAMFAIATDIRPWSSEAANQKTLSGNRRNRPLMPPLSDLLVDEIPWVAMSPPQSFDYVLFANIDTGHGREPQLIRANRNEPGMVVKSRVLAPGMRVGTSFGASSSNQTRSANGLT
jgi:hypothetical protein